MSRMHWAIHQSWALVRLRPQVGAHLLAFEASSDKIPSNKGGKWLARSDSASTAALRGADSSYTFAA